MEIGILSVNIAADAHGYVAKVAMVNDKPVPIPIAVKVCVSDGTNTGDYTKRMLLKRSTKEAPMIADIPGQFGPGFVFSATYTFKIQGFGILGFRAISPETTATVVAAPAGGGGSNGNGNGYTESETYGVGSGIDILGKVMTGGGLVVSPPPPGAPSGDTTMYKMPSQSGVYGMSSPNYNVSQPSLNVGPATITR